MIDNIPVTAPEGTTVLQAAHSIGIKIPTLCHVQGHPPLTSCMVCLVRINNAKKLVPSCAMLIQDGMIIESETVEIHQARKTALELLLGDHRGDCIGPCQDVCPAHMDIPRMIRLLSQGKYTEAIKVVKEHIALPAILGRICSEICEKGCRRGHIDSPVSICSLKRFAADVDMASDSPYIPRNAESTGQTVAVVGSGPAGLSAAYYLARDGHKVILYDRDLKPGGTLRKEVGAGKLEANVLDAEIAILAQSGIIFNMGASIDSHEDLLKKHNAVVLCIGEISKEQADSMGIKHSGKGVQVDAVTLMTEKPGLFAAGSAVAPAKHAIRACAQGKQVAHSVTCYLSGKIPSHDEKPYSVRMGHLHPGELDILADDVSRHQRVPASIEGFSEEQVQIETARCLHCECAKVDNCRLRDVSYENHASPTAYRAEHRHYTRDCSHPEIVFEPSKCISCGLCVQVAEERAEQIGLTFFERGFDVKIGVPFEGSLPAGLKHAARECAEICPTAALHLKMDGEC